MEAPTTVVPLLLSAKMQVVEEVRSEMIIMTGSIMKLIGLILWARGVWMGSCWGGGVMIVVRLRIFWREIRRRFGGPCWLLDAVCVLSIGTRMVGLD